jgi:hypothetical protein
MAPRKRFERVSRGRPAAVVVAVLVVAGLAWETFGDEVAGVVSQLSVRTVEGVYFGTMPAPVQPSLTDPAADAFAPEKRYRLMTIRRIPRIDEGGPLPHPYVGDCKNCHLYRGGPGPGSQTKTPVAAVLERLSRVTKLGPPLRPTSRLPHPPAGRCIKCHDIVVKVPVERKKGGFLWRL